MTSDRRTLKCTRRKICTDDGTGDADTGPLVTKAHHDKMPCYTDAGEADSAKIVIDGRTLTGEAGAERDPAGSGWALPHPHQSPHRPLARPEPRRPQPRVPPKQVTLMVTRSRCAFTAIDIYRS